MREHALFQQSRLPCGVFVRLILVAFAWPCLLPHSNHDWLVQNNPCPGNRKNGGAGGSRTLDLRPLCPQGAACGGTVEIRQVHELIQDPRLLVRGHMKILSSQLLHDSLSLPHSQPHLLTSHLLSLSHCSSSVCWVKVNSSMRQ